MKIWIVRAEDWSQCFYEGDTPSTVIKAFSSEEGAQAFMAAEKAKYKNKKYRYSLSWEVEEMDVE